MKMLEDRVPVGDELYQYLIDHHGDNLGGVLNVDPGHASATLSGEARDELFSLCDRIAVKLVASPT